MAHHPLAHRSWISRSRGWISILLLAPVSIDAIFSPLTWPLDSWLQFTCDCAGWVLFVSGAAWRWWATLYIGGQKDRQLSQQGPYSISRNPLYFGTLLMAISVAVFVQSLAFAAMLVAVAAFYLGVTIPNEESRLRVKFGQAYTDYCARVPRFFPRFSLYQTPPSVVVESYGLQSEWRRALRWVWLPVICHLLCHLRSEPTWPHIRDSVLATVFRSAAGIVTVRCDEVLRILSECHWLEIH